MGLTKKQHEVLQFIINYTGEHGYSPTQREIKEAFGLKSYGSVQRYLKYLKEAGHLEQDWNSKRGLTIIEDGPAQNSGISLNAISSELELPLLGDIAAGNPIEALENPTETVSIPHSMVKPGGRHFALRVKGESMIEDGILDGDIAIIRQQDNAGPGQTVVAVIDGEATLKKFYKKSSSIELHPANHTMKPIIVGPQNHFNVAGVLVGLFRTYV
jgi:SOS regulatory protein LexA